MKRRVNPRDLPFAAEGGTYHVVNGQLQAEADAPAAVEEAASTEEAHAAAPSARPQGGRTSRTKE